MKQMPLSRGMFTTIDDCDADLIVGGWNAHNRRKKYYASHTQRMGKRCKTISLHLLIAARMGLTGKIDHKNGNSLDNRRKNLRAATSIQNGQNAKRYSSNTSGYTGVAWSKRSNKWIAYISDNGKRVHLGYFTDKHDAAMAYNKAAKQYHGEFATFNTVGK
jgi:hypothetical protein